MSTVFESSSMESLSLVLARVAVGDTEKHRVEYLHSIPQRYVGPIRAILYHMFKPEIKFLLPEGAPPYTSKDDEPAALFSEIRRFYLYVEGGHPTLKQGKREMLFQQALEGMTTSDAELFIAMKEKRAPYTGLNKQLVKKVYPDLL